MSAVGPVGGVVDLGSCSGAVTVGEGAAAVAGEQCSALVGWVGRPGRAAPRQPAVAGRLLSKASCSRWGGVRSSGPSASSGRVAAGGVRIASQIAWQVGESRPSRSPVPSDRRFTVSRRWLLLAALVRAGSVRVQVGEDPLTQQPNRQRITGASVHQQRPFHLLGMLGAVGAVGVRNRFDYGCYLCCVVEPDLTVAESLGGGGVNRFQRFADEAAPGTEPLHRQDSLTCLGLGAAQLRTDQLRNPRNPSVAGTFRAFSSASTATCRYRNRLSSTSRSPTAASNSASAAVVSCSITHSILPYRTARDNRIRRRIALFYR